MDNGDTLEILKQLEQGAINADQARARLDAPPPSRGNRTNAPRVEMTGAPEWIRRLWLYPLALGTGIVALGAWIIAATVHANILWWLVGVPLVLLGALVVALAASARSGHWLYVNVQERGPRGHHIRFGMPFPFGLVRVALWIAQFAIHQPQLKTKFRSRPVGANVNWNDLDELVAALEYELDAQNGISVDVDGDGEQVQVYIV